MTWAADKHADAIGFTEHVDRWWDHLGAGGPDPATMDAIEGRRALHLQRKEALDVAAIGRLLAAHERYCTGRTGEDKISPGIRFGLWWVCFTANRRFSTVKLRRDDLLPDDPLQPGWGRAMWPADTMKAKVPFLAAAAGAGSRHRDRRDRRLDAARKERARHHENGLGVRVDAAPRPGSGERRRLDVSKFFERHLARMRSARALDGLPYFSLHLARSVMANFLDGEVSPVASSLVLAHTLPKTATESSPTTREYYLTSQRMDVKMAAMTAMAAWSEALCRAVERAGGALPTPTEGVRVGKAKQQAAQDIAQQPSRPRSSLCFPSSRARGATASPLP